MFGLALLVAQLVAPAPSPAEAGRLSAYVSNLSHPRYAVREAASKRLAEAGGAAKGALREAAVKGDPETAARAKAALDSIVGLELESLRPLPEIDAAWWNEKTKWYLDDPFAPPDMLAHLNAYGRDKPPYANYYRATESWVGVRLAAGTSPKLTRLILAEMHRKDAQFLPTRDLPTVDPDEYRAAGRPAK